MNLQELGTFSGVNSKSLLIIVHGSKEYIERYDEFVAYLNSNQFDTFNYILPNHDRRNIDNKYYVSSEVQIFNELEFICKQYQSKYDNINLFGHSLGALVVLNFTDEFSYLINKIIISGATYPSNKLLIKSGLVFTNLFIKLTNGEHESLFVENLVFKRFEKMIRKRDSTTNWLSYNLASSDEFNNNKLSQMPFTLSYHKLLLDLDSRLSNIYINNETLVITGVDDPVSNFTKDIDNLVKHFAAYKRIDYINMKHEILFENDRHIIFNDIKLFLQKI